MVKLPLAFVLSVAVMGISATRWQPRLKTTASREREGSGFFLDFYYTGHFASRCCSEVLKLETHPACHSRQNLRYRRMLVQKLRVATQRRKVATAGKPSTFPFEWSLLGKQLLANAYGSTHLALTLGTHCLTLGLALQDRES